jgi:superfamily II DNA or RNA helicase
VDGTDRRSAPRTPDTRHCDAGSTGTGKTHLAIAIARSCIRSGARGRFYNVVDLVNRLEIETRNGSRVQIEALPTDEESMIARHTASLVRQAVG